MMVGVNGGGKTTSIGKLAHKFSAEGKSVMLAGNICQIYLTIYLQICLKIY